MGMGYQSISTLGASPLFQTLVSQGKVASGKFSFHLADSGSELYLGGMNSALFSAASTKAYPVVSQSYWLLAAKANVGGSAVGSVGQFNAIIDTGTSVIVVRPSSSFSPFLVVDVVADARPSSSPSLALAGSYCVGSPVLGCGPQLGRVRLGLLHLPVRGGAVHLVFVRPDVRRAVGHLARVAQPRQGLVRQRPLRRRHRRRRHWHQRLDPRSLVRRPSPCLTLLLLDLLKLTRSVSLVPFSFLENVYSTFDVTANTVSFSDLA